MDELVLRRACDRCHTQKLLCRRDGDSTSCARCIRANRSCTTSASRRSKRPRPAQQENSNTSNCNNTSNNNNNNNTNNNNTRARGDCSSTTPTTSATLQVVPELSDISGALDHLMSPASTPNFGPQSLDLDNVRASDILSSFAPTGAPHMDHQGEPMGTSSSSASSTTIDPTSALFMTDSDWYTTRRFADPDLDMSGGGGGGGGGGSLPPGAASPHHQGPGHPDAAGRVSTPHSQTRRAALLHSSNTSQAKESVVLMSTTRNSILFPDDLDYDMVSSAHTSDVTAVAGQPPSPDDRGGCIDPGLGGGWDSALTPSWLLNQPTRAGSPASPMTQQLLHKDHNHHIKELSPGASDAWDAQAQFLEMCQLNVQLFNRASEVAALFGTGSRPDSGSGGGGGGWIGNSNITSITSAATGMAKTNGMGGGAGASRSVSSVFDNVLALIFRFLQFLRRCPSPSSPPGTSPDSISTNGGGSNSMSNTSNPSATPSAMPEQQLDPGLMFMVFSCYTRILQICRDLLRGIKDMVESDAWVAAASGREFGGGIGIVLLPPPMLLPLPSLTASCLGSGGDLDGYPALRLGMTLGLVDSMIGELKSVLARKSPRSSTGGGRDGRDGSRASRLEEQRQTTYGIGPPGSQQMIHLQEQTVEEAIEEIRALLRKAR